MRFEETKSSSQGDLPHQISVWLDWGSQFDMQVFILLHLGATLRRLRNLLYPASGSPSSLVSKGGTHSLLNNKNKSYYVILGGVWRVGERVFLSKMKSVNVHTGWELILAKSKTQYITSDWKKAEWEQTGEAFRSRLGGRFLWRKNDSYHVLWSLLPLSYLNNSNNPVR